MRPASGGVVRAAVDGEHDAQAAAPGGEDHAVDRRTLLDGEVRLTGPPGHGHPHGTNAEIARVAERPERMRLVTPLEAVVGDSDEQARRRVGRAHQRADNDRAGCECPTGASHGLSIGAPASEPEVLDE